MGIGRQSALCAFVALCLSFLVLLGGLAAPAEAQDAPSHPASETRATILRSTEGDAHGLDADIDRVLARELARAAGIVRLSFSPIEYEEVLLTVGCPDSSRECLLSIARTVDVDAIVVRQINAGRNLGVTLTYFDATSSDEPTRATAEMSGTPQDIEAQMPLLVRRLFDLTDAPDVTEPEDEPDVVRTRTVVVHEETDGVSVWPWLALGAGAAAETVGILFALLAQDSFDEYATVEVATTHDVDRAQRLLDRAESRGLIGNVLMISGGVLAAAGATLLVIELSSGDDEPERGATLSLAPETGGATAVLRIPWGASW